MIYIYALPRAQERYRGLTPTGRMAYPDHVVDIPAEAVDEAFVSNVIALITRLASQTPARRVPQLRGVPGLRNHTDGLSRTCG